MKWTPRDVISLVVITGGFVLLGLGRDSYIAWTTMGVVGSYYGIIGAPAAKDFIISRQNGKETAKCKKDSGV